MTITVMDLAFDIYNRIGNIGSEKPVFDTLKRISAVADAEMSRVGDDDLKAYASSLDEKQLDKILVLRVCTLREALLEAFRVEACGQCLSAMWRDWENAEYGLDWKG